MKHIFYFILGLIATPVMVVMAIYGTGKEIGKSFIYGYKKGVKKNDKKNNQQGKVRSSPEGKPTEH